MSTSASVGAADAQSIGAPGDGTSRRTGTCSTFRTVSSDGTAIPDVLPVSALTEGSADAPAYDVVVVGFGIAGGCAALEAARAGARVLLLERAAVHGGTSSMSGGHFYLGGGTAVQQATGHEDSAEEMYAYLVAASKEPEHDKIRAYCDDSVEHFDWVEALGFEFERSYYPEKAVIQPGTQGLMFTGNEKVWPYVEKAKPAPRGHKVPVPGDTGGHQDGDGPAARAGRGGGGRGPLRDRGHQPGPRRGGGRRRRRVALVRNERGRGRPGCGRGRRRLRDEPRHGRRAHPGPGLEAVHPRVDVRRRARHPPRPVGGRRAQAHGRAVHHRAGLPAVDPADRPHRQHARASASSPRTATTRGPRSS